MTRHPIYLLLFTFILSAQIGCTGSITRSKTPPDWTIGESKTYPNARYLTATGSASDAESAKDRAMGNLAKIFESHIVESSTTHSDTRSQVTSSGESVDLKQRLVQRVNIHTEKVLEGIRIAEQWQNTTDLTYFALAVLPREQASRIISDEIIRLDKDTAFLLAGIEAEHDDLKRFSSYQQVTALQEARNNFQKKLKVIDIKGKGLPPKWSLVELKALSASTITGISMSVYVDSTNRDIGNRLGLTKLVQAAMSHIGITVVEDRADYTLVLDIDLPDPWQEQGWYWQRGTLGVRLVDANSGITRGEHSWLLKTSATKESLLLSRFRQGLSNTLKNGLKTALIGMANTR